MSYVSLMLLSFVGLGLAKERFGKFTYVVMGVIIIAYVAYTYHKPQ